MNKTYSKILGTFIALALLASSIPLHVMADGGNTAGETEDTETGVTEYAEPQPEEQPEPATDGEPEQTGATVSGGDEGGGDTDAVSGATEEIEDTDAVSGGAGEIEDTDAVSGATGEIEDTDAVSGATGEIEDTDAVSGPTVVFSAEDVTAGLGDESFDLMDGVSAVDENGDTLEVTVADMNGFDIFTTGTYQVVYHASHPGLDDVFPATRTVTVEAVGAVMAASTLDTDSLQTLLDTAQEHDTIVIAGDIALDRPLTIHKSVTLASADGTVTLTPYGQQDVRHIIVEGNSHVTLTFDGVVLDGVDNASGGGIFGKTDLTLVDAVIENVYYHSSSGSSVSGGAVGMAPGTKLVLSGDTRLENNRASHGGAVYMGEGGEVTVSSGAVIKDNHGSATGGGIHLGSGSSLKVQGEITGNNSVQGGGVYIDNTGGAASVIRVDGGKVNGNKAGITGTGIAARNNGSGNAVTVILENGAQVNGNESDGNGATISATNVIIHDGQVNNNVAGSTCFIAVSAYNFEMHGGEIRDNLLSEFYNNYGLHHSGTVSAHNVTMTGGVISGNKWSGQTSAINDPEYAFWGGAIYVSPTSTEDSVVSITGGTFEDNNAVYGGALYLRGTNRSGNIDIRIENALFSGNTADQGGGAVRFTATPDYSGAYTAAIKNTTFTGNTAPGLGGAVLVDDHTGDSRIRLTVGEGTVFDRNQSKFGGGIYNQNGNITIGGNARFTRNASTSDGGVLYNYRSGTMAINGDGAVFENNHAYGNGSVLYSNGSTSSISGSVTLQNNYADGVGGAVVAISSTTPLTIGGPVTFTGNSGTRGGAIFSQNAPVAINSGVTFTGNTARASTGGGAIFTNNYDNVTAQGVRFLNNRAPKGYHMTDEGDIAMYHSKIQAETVTAPFTYAYNHHDINYTVGDPVDPDNNYYIVSFHANGGSFAGGTLVQHMEAEAGALVDSSGLPALAHSSDYSFTGWYTDAEAANLWNFAEETMPGHNLNLYAGWDGSDEDSDGDNGDGGDSDSGDGDSGNGDGGNGDGDSGNGNGDNGGNGDGGNGDGGNGDGGNGDGGSSSGGGSSDRDKYPGDQDNREEDRQTEEQTPVPEVTPEPGEELATILPESVPLTTRLMKLIDDRQAPLSGLPSTGDNRVVAGGVLFALLALSGGIAAAKRK